jgi:RNA polymerase sigma factor (sigma-70 family)
VDKSEIYIIAPLIEECRRGSSKAQFRLYNQYSKAMFNVAFRIMNNREDAEDILQETFVECFRNLDTYRFESTFGAWLKRILINRCINHLRKKKSDIVLCENLPERAIEEETEPVFNSVSIAHGIDQLPDGYRVIFSLYLLEGYDHGEIAQILGISESTSKSQYSRAKEKLKSILSKELVYGQA